MTQYRFTFRICIVAWMSTFGSPSVTYAVTTVAREISLLVDNSGSISDPEFALQMNGYAAGFRTVKSQIASLSGGIAVNLIFFDNDATEAFPWMQLATEGDVENFADDLETFNRLPAGVTNMIPALQMAISITTNEFESDVLIVDVSGDGRQNPMAGTLNNPFVQTERDALFAAGVDQINGLAIGNETFSGVTLEQWYQANIVVGPEAFLITTADFSSFEGAVTEKLQLEIIPEPSTFALGLMGLLMLSCHGRRRRRR